MDNLFLKRIQSLTDRLSYMQDIFAGKHADSVSLLQQKLDEFTEKATSDSLVNPYEELVALEDLFKYVEARLDASITPLDKVRIVRHPHMSAGYSGKCVRQFHGSGRTGRAQH